MVGNHPDTAPSRAQQAADAVPQGRQSRSIPGRHQAECPGVERTRFRPTPACAERVSDEIDPAAYRGPRCDGRCYLTHDRQPRPATRACAATALLCRHRRYRGCDGISARENSGLQAFLQNRADIEARPSAKTQASRSAVTDEVSFPGSIPEPTSLLNRRADRSSHGSYSTHHFVTRPISPLCLRRRAPQSPRDRTASRVWHSRPPSLRRSPPSAVLAALASRPSGSRAMA